MSWIAKLRKTIQKYLPDAQVKRIHPLLSDRAIVSRKGRTYTILKKKGYEVYLDGRFIIYKRRLLATIYEIVQRERKLDFFE